MKEFSRFTKILFGIGAVFLIYGFVSRIIPINFFWESKTIGWTLIFVGLVSLLLSGIKKRKEKNEKTIWNKIGIGIICFILLIQLILIIVISNSDAYNVSTKHLKQDTELKKETGEIIGFGLIPVGSISVKTDSYGVTGNANINLIVKGTKTYKTVKIMLFKDYDANWKVDNVD